MWDESRKLTSFIHLRKKAKNRLFSSIFSSLLILFSIQEKRWHGEHRKRKHQQKNYEFAPASTRPRIILFRTPWTRRVFIFFEKHPQSVIIFLDDFFVGRISIFLFPFSFHDLFPHTKTHAHSHTQSANYQHWHRMSNHQSSPRKKIKLFAILARTLVDDQYTPHVLSPLTPPEFQVGIAHFSRFLRSRLTSLAITTFSQQNVFGGSSLSFPLFSCMERKFLAPTSKG